MNKVYFLKTCSTCTRILKELDLSAFEIIELKSTGIDEAQLNKLQAMSGSYEALFNRKSTLYKTLELKNKTLTEQEYKNYILQHYTFLKRPVFVVEKEIFIGNAKNVIADLNAKLAK